MRSEQGQTLVEFALILPLLLVLVIGMFDFGQALNSKNDLNFLANTAARYAEVNSCAPCTTSGANAIADYVKSTADTSQIQNSLNITFCLPNGTGAVGDPLQVSATGTMPWVGTKLPGLVNTPNLALKSSVTVRILTAPNPPSSPALYTASAPPC